MGADIPAVPAANPATVDLPSAKKAKLALPVVFPGGAASCRNVASFGPGRFRDALTDVTADAGILTVLDR